MNLVELDRALDPFSASAIHFGRELVIPVWWDLHHLEHLPHVYRVVEVGRVAHDGFTECMRKNPESYVIFLRKIPWVFLGCRSAPKVFHLYFRFAGHFGLTETAAGNVSHDAFCFSRIHRQVHFRTTPSKRLFQNSPFPLVSPHGFSSTCFFLQWLGRGATHLSLGRQFVE